MGTRPLVSVVIPTYNRERYLRDAVESVVAQTYDGWELLVVDDGSTDGTRRYLDEVGDSRVHGVLRGHCGHPGTLRNVGVRHARGSYIAFLDSDDVWLPDKLARQLADLEAHPDCGWGYSGYVHMDERGRGSEWRNPHHPWTPRGGWILEDVVAEPALIALPTVMVARDLFATVGGFDESLLRCEDVDLWIRLAEISAASVVPMPLVKVRVHGEDRGVGTLELLACMNRIYAGLLSRATSSQLRRLSRRKRATVNIDCARKLRAARRYREARQALRISLPYAGWHVGWWIELLKTSVRSATSAWRPPRPRSAQPS